MDPGTPDLTTLQKQQLLQAHAALGTILVWSLSEAATHEVHSPSRSLLLLIWFRVFCWSQLQHAERRGRSRVLQGRLGLGLDGLLNHMVLGDGQDGRCVMLELLRAARRGGGGFPVRQERPRRPLDDWRDRRRVLGDAGSAHEGLVALDERRGQGGLRLLGRAGDNGDGND